MSKNLSLMTVFCSLQSFVFLENKAILNEEYGSIILNLESDFEGPIC